MKNLNKAGQAAEEITDHLRAALGAAGAVESIIILDLILRAAELEKDIVRLIDAKQTEAR